MATLQAEPFDVSAGGFGDPEAVERQQREQGVVAGASEAGGDEERSDLVAIGAGGVGLVVEAGAADVDCW